MEKNNVIDFEVVSKQEAQAAGSPAEQPKIPAEQLDQKYGVASYKEIHLNKENITYANSLLQKIQKPNPEISPSVTVTKQETTQPAPTPLSTDEFITKFGGSSLKRARDSRGYVSPKDIALELYSDQPTSGLKAATAVLTPALGVIGVTGAAVIAQMGGIGAFVAAATVPGAILAAGIPVLGVGVVGYGAYKMFNSWRSKRAFKKNFGRDVDDVLGRV